MEIEFKKYSEVENHYQNKHIAKFIEQQPEILKVKYYIEEKIHGSNFQFRISASDVVFGKRTAYLDNDEKFYGYLELVSRDKYVKLINDVQTWIKENHPDSHITLFGELYGKGVQSEVFYSDTKEFSVFDVAFNDIYMSPGEVRTFMAGINHDDKLVPLLAIVDTLQEALDYNEIFDSVISGKEDNKAEGIVIKPSEYIRRNDGARFIIKKKNPKFKENESSNKGPRVKKEVVPLTDLQLKFIEYLNENRVNGIMSKFGEISDTTQIGQYIKYVHDDALTDFQKENEEYTILDKDQIKEINSVTGKTCVPLIQKFL